MSREVVRVEKERVERMSASREGMRVGKERGKKVCE